jgi:HAD superfamily hydrolase (TIGR01549 family)
MSNSVDHIFVDLDGTLVRTDMFFESILQLIKRNPINLVRIVIWILQGRAIAKEKIANLVEVDAENLPYESSLIEYLREKKAQGKNLILATASHRIWAEKVSSYLGIFDHVIATDSQNNLKGKRKLAAIRAHIGDAEFSYCGDSAADRPIWSEASQNVFVDAPHKDVAAAQSQNKAERIIISDQSAARAFIREMRIHQYAKNALIFVPLFTAHHYQDLTLLSNVALAFVCFSLCASGVYFLNDLLDLEADRVHAKKRFRPLASGDLPISLGIAGAILLPVLAFGLAGTFLNLAFIAVLAAYFLLTNAYSFFLKRVSTADVMTLAVLYTLRVVAGAAAAGIALSSWLMAFSVFVFVSLAYLQRYIEVAALSEAVDKVHGRGYSAADSETMFSLGIANITASVLVLALYINSEEVTVLYQSPIILWLLCLLMLYWGNRIWVGARRGKIADDPVVFAIKDKVSRLVGVGFVLVVLAAKYIQT